MEKLQGKVAIVTGASSGIGAATAKALAEAGLNVVGVARRKERIEELAKQLKYPKGKLYAFRVDMRSEEDIVQAFKWTSDNVGPVHVLVNNAGGGMPTTMVDGNAQAWKSVIDTNVLGVAIAAREAIKVMRANNIDGHIINVNSVVGHKVPDVPELNIYPASKYAVTALTETLRLELIRLGSKIKVTSLSPGVVVTEAFDTAGLSMEDILKANGIDKPLSSEDLADTVKYIISVPPHVQITELTIRPVGEEL